MPWLHQSFLPNPLQGDHSSLRDGCCLLEGQTGGFTRPVSATSTDILGKPIMIEPHLPKDFIAWVKLVMVSANPFHSPGDIRTEDAGTSFGFEQPMEAGIERFPGEMLPVRPVDRDRLHLDQDFIVGRGRCFDLGEVKPIGWAVGSVHDGFHAFPPLGEAMVLLHY